LTRTELAAMVWSPKRWDTSNASMRAGKSDAQSGARSARGAAGKETEPSSLSNSASPSSACSIPVAELIPWLMAARSSSSSPKPAKCPFGQRKSPSLSTDRPAARPRRSSVAEGSTTLERNALDVGSLQFTCKLANVSMQGTCCTNWTGFSVRDVHHAASKSASAELATAFFSLEVAGTSPSRMAPQIFSPSVSNRCWRMG